MQSGDRIALDASIDRLRSLIEQKGGSLTGPHTRPAKSMAVPLYKTHLGDRRFGHWSYQIYSRHLEVIGHEGIAREVASFNLPSSISIAITIEDGEGMHRKS